MGFVFFAINIYDLDKGTNIVLFFMLSGLFRGDYISSI